MPKFDLYSSTYNLKWAKHLNFSWTEPNALMPTNQGGVSKGTPHPQLIKSHTSEGYTMLLGAFLLLNHIWLNHIPLLVIRS